MTVTDPTIDNLRRATRLLEGKVAIVTGASRGIGRRLDLCCGWHA